MRKIAGIAAVFILLWIAYPRSMATLINTDEQLSIKLFLYYEHGECEDTDSLEAVIEPGSPEMQAIQDVLSQYRYRIALSKLMSDYRLDMGGLTIQMVSAGNTHKGFQFGADYRLFSQLSSSQICTLTDSEGDAIDLCKALIDAIREST